MIRKPTVPDPGVGIKTGGLPPGVTWHSLFHRNKKKYNRLSWDDYFLNIAKAVSLRSTCPRLQVGAVITHNNRIIATGFNGAKSKEAHCIDVGCDVVDNHCRRTIHAEANALDRVDFSIYRNSDLSIYITHSPCTICAKLLHLYGITKLSYDKSY